MRPESFRTPVRLVGEHVRLEPLAESDAEALAPIWALPAVHRYLIGFQEDPDRPDVRALIRQLLARQADGTDLAFTVVRTSDGRPVGLTRFLDIQRPHHKVEVGGTWLDPSVWGTAINPESKLLMLRHAFATEEAHRVILKVDARNERSRRAIARLGATEEAVLRQNLWLSEGCYRDTVVFRILRAEWPGVEAGLRDRLARPGPTEGARTGAVAALAAASVPSPARGRAVRGETGMEFRSPVTMAGRFVELAPLERHHRPEIERAGRDPAIWQYLRWGGARPVPELVDGVLTELLEGWATGEVLPFVIRALPDRRIVGLFRYLNIDRPNRSVELGTWVDSEYWRTPVNTEVKFLTLSHAFERESAHRVQMQTDRRNVRSQRAIERLGAVREGRHDENFLLPDGTYRTSIVYSILESEWPTVRRALAEKLARPWPGAPDRN
ncbi:MAG TPA: GNAT family protein [Thermoplasmata archaeon]|nr:GNAT family protein [Thermoplasmata archaeon]